MSQVLFNQLAYVGKLEASGFDARQARGAAEALGDAFTQAVATKGDIVELRNELKGDISELRGELKGVEASLTTKIDRVDASLKIAIAKSETKFEKSLREQTFRSVSLIGGLLAIFTVISHYWK